MWESTRDEESLTRRNDTGRSLSGLVIDALFISASKRVRVQHHCNQSLLKLLRVLHGPRCYGRSFA